MPHFSHLLRYWKAALLSVGLRPHAAYTGRPGKQRYSPSDGDSVAIGHPVQEQQQQQLPTQQQKTAIYSNPYQDADVVRPPVRMFDPVGGASWGANWGAPVPQLPPYPEVRRHGDAPALPAELQYPEYRGRPANYYADRQPETWPAERYAPPSGYGGLEAAAPGAPKPQESAAGLRDQQQQLAHDLQHSKEGAQASRVVVKVAPRPQYAEPYKMAVEDTQDGQAGIPRGAILSLTIGLVLTAVMAILIGCRLRVVRRRLRKGENGYAHDADYLVNGMYL
ncbi:hypothetical protein HUJ04_000012 [Dendroctonus ponderosae]|nr:hypothetical protein HUJ04_000012 [Dendroctonus ponderosae]